MFNSFIVSEVKNAKKPPMKINSFQKQNHCSTDKAFMGTIVNPSRLIFP